jgi:uncharacterized membrane protein affecting hemolysin expression
MGIQKLSYSAILVLIVVLTIKAEVFNESVFVSQAMRNIDRSINEIEENIIKQTKISLSENLTSDDKTEGKHYLLLKLYSDI